MKFQKYYSDIKSFPGQFSAGAKIAGGVSLAGGYEEHFDKVVLCGMGGSSLPGDLINNILANNPSAKIFIDIARSYDIPSSSTDNTLFITCSYSGNTEETLSCYRQILTKGFKQIVFASGGELLRLAQADGIPAFMIPGGLQPRLSTGYIIAGILSILERLKLAPAGIVEKLINAGENFAGLVDESQCENLAKRIKGKVPIIYAEEENFSVARIGKIKMNENAKTQAFWNFFPELNHNEMVGFTNLVMKPFFIIFDSNYSNVRNHKRITVFSEIVKNKGIDLEVVKFEAKNLIEEMLAGYYFMDLVSYYLACEYGIDPEPVEMVEEFKKKMRE